MAEPIQETVICSIQAAGSLYHRLFLLVVESSSGKTAVLHAVAGQLGASVININLEILKKIHKPFRKCIPISYRKHRELGVRQKSLSSFQPCWSKFSYVTMAMVQSPNKSTPTSPLTGRNYATSPRMIPCW